MKKKISTLLFLLFIYISSNPAYAQEKHAGTSAEINRNYAQTAKELKDNRAEILQKYLEKYNSPLASNAQDFVIQADRYNIDWKLLVAISGVESTFAHAEPAYCYNSWGYNIFGSNTRCFSDYKEAITTISKDLREKYMDKWGAQDVYQIGKIYAASPTWSYKVANFMDDIDQFGSQFQTQTLSISL